MYRCADGESCFRRYRFSTKVRAAAVKAFRSSSVRALNHYRAQRAKAQAEFSAYMRRRVASYTGKSRKQACEHSAISISCSKGYSIDILSAFYGRTNKVDCRNKAMKSTRCSAASATSRVKSACQGKRSCTVKSSNAVFGDPCVGTYKYLKIAYRCKTYNPTRAVLKERARRRRRHQAQLARLAERYSRRRARIQKSFKKYHSTVGRCAFAKASSVICNRFKCGKRHRCTLRKFRFIGKVAYRPVCVRKPPGWCGKVVCKPGQRCVVSTVRQRVGAVYKNVQTTSCKKIKSPCEVVRCGRNRRCVTRFRFSRSVRLKASKRYSQRVAKARAAYKRRRAAAIKRLNSYLRAFARRTTKYKNVRPTITCEHGYSRLGCPSSYTIEVLSAFYGRTSNSLCRSGPIKTTNCRSRSATSAVRRACQGRSSCTVRASNSVFGDPCAGTFKYMQINYRCKSTTPTASERKRKDQRIRRHRNYLVKLSRKFKQTIAYLQRRLRRFSGLKARCVRRKRSVCNKRRCRRGRVCVAQRISGRKVVARCVRPRALCYRRRCARGTRCIIRRTISRAARKFHSIRRKMHSRYRAKRRSLRASYRRSRRNARAAIKLAARASRKSIAKAVKAKNAKKAKDLRKQWRRHRSLLRANLRKQRRAFKKAIRKLRLRFRRSSARLSRKYRRRKFVRFSTRCAVDRCYRVKCKSGFSCRNLKRFSKKFATFLQQRRILSRSYRALRRRLLRSYYAKAHKASKQFRKRLARHRSGIRRAKTASARRSLKLALQRQLRSFRQVRRAADRQYRQAVKLARKNYAQRRKALRQKHAKRSAFKNRIKIVARCVRQVRRSCRNVKCSAGKRCVSTIVSSQWFRRYRRSVKRGNRRQRSRLVRSVRKLRRLRRQPRRRLQRRRRPAVRSFRRWFGRTFRRIGASRRYRKKAGRRRRRSRSRSTRRRARKTRSFLWGRYRRAARRYRRRFRRTIRRVSRRGLRKYAKSHSPAQKSVFKNFKRNARKFSHRVGSLRRRVARQLRQLKSAYRRGNKATAADRKKLKKKILRRYRKIRRAYQRALKRAVVSFYKRRVTVAKKLQKRVKKLRPRSRVFRRRFIRRAICVAVNPCRGKRCSRGFSCRVRKIKAKNGRTTRIARCERKTNKCSKVNCSKGTRCIVRRVATRAFRMYRWYARTSRRRFRRKARRLFKRLRSKRRRSARRVLKQYKTARQNLKKRFHGRKLVKRVKAVKRSVRRNLRRIRRRTRSIFRRQRAALKRRFRKSVRRFAVRFLRKRRRYQTRAFCVKKRINPCKKKRCQKGSTCVVKRQQSMLLKEFQRATNQHVKLFMAARRRLNKLHGRKRRAAIRKLTRQVKRKLRQLHRLYRRRGAFRRSRKLVARCYSLKSMRRARRRTSRRVLRFSRRLRRRTSRRVRRFSRRVRRRTSRRVGRFSRRVRRRTSRRVRRFSRRVRRRTSRRRSSRRRRRSRRR